MSLGSTSTNDEIVAAYDDNASYEENNSVAEARAFVSACRVMIRRFPISSNIGGTTLTLESIKDQMNDAQGWLAANDTSRQSSAGVKHVSFEDFRS